MFADFPFNTTVPSLLLNGVGDTAFYATLIGPGVNATNDHGVWVQNGGNLRLVARAGDPAPGTADGVRFVAVGGVSLGLGHTLNGSGQVALRASLAGTGVNTSNDEGLWAEVDGELQLVIREGDVIEVAPGDERTVGGFLNWIVGSGNEDGRASTFNDLGQLAFSVYFSDLSGGVFVADTTGTNITLGDADGDGDVDLDDFAFFSDCVSGPTIPAAANCIAAFDFDSDGDVDLLDFAAFQAVFF